MAPSRGALGGCSRNQSFDARVPGLARGGIEQDLELAHRRAARRRSRSGSRTSHRRRARPATSAVSCASMRSVTDTAPRAYASVDHREVLVRGCRGLASTGRWTARSSRCGAARTRVRASTPSVAAARSASLARSSCRACESSRAAQAAGEQRQRRLQRHAPGFVVGRAGHGLRAGAALVECTSSRSTPARGPADSTRAAPPSARAAGAREHRVGLRDLRARSRARCCTAYSMNTAHFAGVSRNACVRGLETSASGSSSPDSTVLNGCVAGAVQDAQQLGLRLAARATPRPAGSACRARAARPSADSRSAPRDPPSSRTREVSRFRRVFSTLRAADVLHRLARAAGSR